jgi:hypothetical protein
MGLIALQAYSMNSDAQGYRWYSSTGLQDLFFIRKTAS